MIDKSKALPQIDVYAVYLTMPGGRTFLRQAYQMIAEAQRKADWERMRPLVEAARKVARTWDYNLHVELDKALADLGVKP